MKSTLFLFLISFLINSLVAKANADDSRNTFPQQNCIEPLVKNVSHLSELKKVIPNATSVVESHCVYFENSKNFGNRALVLYLFHRDKNEASTALVLFKVKGRKLLSLLYKEDLGHRIFPFYIQEGKKLKSHFLFTFDFDSDGKQNIFVNGALGVASKDLQVFELGNKSFKQLSFTQINNKISQANSKFISSNIREEIILSFMPKAKMLNPFFEVYFQDPKKLSVKKLLSPMKYIKSKL